MTHRVWITVKGERVRVTFRGMTVEAAEAMARELEGALA